MGKRKCKFNEELKKDFPYIISKSYKGDVESGVFCNICWSAFSVASGGRFDLNKHIKTQKHKLCEGAASHSSTKIKNIHPRNETTENELDLISNQLFASQTNVTTSAVQKLQSLNLDGPRGNADTSTTNSAEINVSEKTDHNILAAELIPTESHEHGKGWARIIQKIPMKSSQKCHDGFLDQHDSHSNSKILFDELYKIFGDCDIPCKMCDKFILQLSRHVLSTHTTNVYLIHGQPNKNCTMKNLKSFKRKFQTDDNIGNVSRFSDKDQSPSPSKLKRSLRTRKVINFQEIYDEQSQINQNKNTRILPFPFPNDVKIEVTDFDPEEFDESPVDSFTDFDFESGGTSLLYPEQTCSSNEEGKAVHIQCDDQYENANEGDDDDWDPDLDNDNGNPNNDNDSDEESEAECSEENENDVDIYPKYDERQTDSKIHKCQICYKTFSTIRNLNRHLKRCHKKMIPKPFRCRLCELKFSSTRNLSRHVQQSHPTEKPFVCEICQVGYFLQSKFKSHMRRHTEEKPHRCPSCDLRFDMKYVLNKHYMRVHAGERPFVCELCGATFKDNYAFTVHKRIHTGEKPFMCEVCSKCFTSKHCLRKHSVYHKAERNFICEFCHKAFFSKSNLNTHRKIHIGLKEQVCNKCGKAFQWAHVLKAHLKTHEKI